MLRLGRVFLFALLVAILPATGLALAADTTSDTTPIKTWTGCYIGLNVGYAHADDDARDAPYESGPFAGFGFSWNAGPSGPYETISSSANGAIGGIETGCDYQLPTGKVSIVLGGVADFGGFGGMQGNGTSHLSDDTHTDFDIDWVTSVRGRVGVAGVGSQDLLFYATGGYAAADIDVRAFDHLGSGVMDVSGGGVESGWVVGGGGEWRFADGWSASIEYLHFQFNDIDATGRADAPTAAFPLFENTIGIDTVRVGLKYRL